MITFSSRGSFKKTDAFLSAMSRRQIFRSLDQAGREGVAALVARTPVDSGASANAWRYEVRITQRTATISWLNDHMDDGGGTPVVILLQYGHGTGTGGYVRGQDFINPALKPIFDRIASDVWKEVTSA